MTSDQPHNGERHEPAEGPVTSEGSGDTGTSDKAVSGVGDVAGVQGGQGSSTTASADTPASKTETSPDTRASGATTDNTGPSNGRHRFTLLIPALTFVLGLLLGIGVMAAIRSGETPGAQDNASPTPGQSSPDSGQPTPTPTASVLVTVPTACLEVADDADQILETVKQAAQAARDLEATRLSDLVRQLDTEQAKLRESSDACRDARVTTP